MKTFESKAYGRGFTLIELMIGMVIGVLISAAAVGAFLAHTRTVYEQMSYNQANEDVNEVFAILSRVVMQAHRDTITANPTFTDGVLTAATIDVELLSDTCVWPNNTGACDENWVRIAWSSSGNEANELLIAKAGSSADLPDATVTRLIGGASGNNTRITGLNLVSDGGDPATWLFSVSGKSYARDLADGDDGDIGTTMQGRILPRN